MNATKRIYLDHAATTPLCPEAREAMQNCLGQAEGNASGVYQSAREAKRMLEQARSEVAQLLGALPNEVYFTSGGTESDNWALKGLAARSHPGGHLVTSMIEHPAVLNTCRFLERQGFEITCLQPDRSGRISPEDVRKAIKPSTFLVSVMWANNETGTIEPVSELAQAAHEAGLPFHTDAVQAVGLLPVHFHGCGADMLSLSAHKFYGPKGIGALLIRAGLPIEPLLHGGEQERSLRASTENVIGAVGMAAALKAAVACREAESVRISRLRDTLQSLLCASLLDIVVNAKDAERLPGHLHISIPRVDDQSMIPLLDLNGVEASAGSACTAGSYVESHVMKAIGTPPELLRGSLRLTLGRETSEEDIDLAAERITQTVTSLRGH